MSPLDMVPTEGMTKIAIHQKQQLARLDLFNKQPGIVGVPQTGSQDCSSQSRLRMANDAQKANAKRKRRASRIIK